MPKKFKGENSKAAEARARKDSQKKAEAERIEREKEEEYWRDDDKHASKKIQRKDERERKKIEAAERKQEAKAFLEKETVEIVGKIAKPDSSAKITQANICAQTEKDRREKAQQDEKKRMEKKKLAVQEDLLVENVNRLVIEGEQARTVDEAIRVISDKDVEVDLHPEKRMKAAFTAFQDKMLPQLKQENPSMKLSQLKQLVWKEWQKSPENPLVQRMM